VYVPVVAVTPLSLAARRRWGAGPLVALVALVGLTTLTDLAVGHGHGWVGWAGYAWVWLLAHELGFRWRDGRLPVGRSAAVALGGAAALVALTTVGGYPVSMVGVPGERSNTSPPSLALVALAVTHFGVLSLLRPRLDSWLQRPRVWRRVVAANAMVMTAYLWHMSALALGVIVLLPTGLFPQPAPGSATWWAWRPAWIAALALFLVPLLAGFSRLETGRVGVTAPTTRRAGLASDAGQTEHPGFAGRAATTVRPSWLPRLGRRVPGGAWVPATPVAAGAAAGLSALLIHLSLAGLPVL
jgi:hypothetical protein